MGFDAVFKTLDFDVYTEAWEATQKAEGRCEFYSLKAMSYILHNGCQQTLRQLREKLDKRDNYVTELKKGFK